MNKPSKFQSTTGKVNFSYLLAIPVIIVMGIVSIYIFHEARKAYWDSKITKMCDQDGGINIYDKFLVDDATYESLKNKFGKIDIPLKGSDRSVGSVLIHTFENKIIKSGNPLVRRSQYSIIRVSDNVVIATKIQYSRVDGDLISLHPSSFSCPKIKESLFESVIVRKEMKK